MHPKLGRNDPCHCGSGRKYKRCHLAEDESAAREQRAALAPQPLPIFGQLPTLSQELGLAPADPELDAFNHLPYDQQWPRLIDLATAGEMDPDLLFELAGILRDEVVRRDERGRFAELLARLRAVQPAAYERDLIWYHGWLLEDAVAARATARLPALFAEIATRAEQSIDEVLRLVDIMLYHNQVEALLDALIPEWPRVLDSEEILAYGKAELGTMLMMLQLYRHLERDGGPAVTPALNAAIADLGGMDVERVARILRALSGDAPQPWTAADFVRGRFGIWQDNPEQAAGLEDLTEADGEDEDEEDEDGFSELRRLDGDDDDELLSDLEQAQQEERTPEQQESDAAEYLLGERLFTLLFEWAGWMWRERGVPLARVELMRDTLHSALLNQPPGPELQARLLPQPAMMDLQMAALMSFLSGHVYKAATLFTLLPDYIDYLVLRGLAGEREGRRARQGTLALRDHVERIFRATYADPELLAAIRHAGARR